MKDDDWCIITFCKEDSNIIKRAMEILDKNGLTVCKKANED